MKKGIIFFLVLVLLLSTTGCYSSNTPTSPIIDKAIDENDKNKDKPAEYYDVVVIGGSPEGVAAAVASARNGAKTLLVESRDGLGGLLTYGMLNQLDLGYGINRKQVNEGIFLEWYKMVGRHGTFDIPLGKESFLKLVESEENLTLSLNTKITNLYKIDQAIVGIEIENSKGLSMVGAKRFIDATEDADFAAMAGVPHFIGQEDLQLTTNMAATLVIVLKNVDWGELKKNQATAFGGGKVNDKLGWGFAGVKEAYTPVEDNTQLRALNIGRQSDGIVTINALQIFGVDSLDSKLKEDAIETGKRETVNVVKFLNESMPGFKNAEIATFPSELYIRESRHILAEYQLSITDIWENNDQWDSIGIGAYPVDVQATSLTAPGYYLANPIQYAIPFRSLVPLEVDSLLVASRSTGYSSLAAASARTVPTGMTVGEAAGVAAALSAAEDINFREMTKDVEVINLLQDKLKKQGANLSSFSLDFPYKGEWYYPAIRELLPLGILQGGFDNDLKVDEGMTEFEFLRLISGAIIRMDYEKSRIVFKNYSPWVASNSVDKSKLLTRDSAAEILLKIFNENLGEEILNPWDYAFESKLIDEEIYLMITDNRELLTKEGIHIAANLLKTEQYLKIYQAE